MSQSDGNTMMVGCDLCQQQKRCGPHIYEGRATPSWGAWICNTCRSGNWDGIVVTSAHGKRLIEHLNAKGIDVTLNAKGHLPIPNC